MPAIMIATGNPTAPTVVHPGIYGIHTINVIMNRRTVHATRIIDVLPTFTRELRRVNWPTDFNPTGIEKYDGKTNPESWLSIYTLVVRAAVGDSKTMANYLHVALADSTRSWLTRLPRGSIDS
jgi:hypothetical protein|uniref:Retrotransposon protein, putative, Ty3-gypsy subclass n=2 Tax=Oryza sativa subsp. japonica TaxID=39947 RepID=Q75GY2_ORYSJ|nr:hypothetical protein [Oryza sativa Japonica Group]ABF98045.1 retrotransposon protein, putative, Ty3-gypsy subclass [Oryza sativa Japonica Group]